MALAASLAGYTVPLRVVLVAIALVVGLGLAVLFWLTIGLSIYRSIQTTRREQVRGELEDRFLDMLYDPAADWSEWAGSVSGVERAVLESLLDEYLRELDGHYADTLRELGSALDIPDRSRRQLETRNPEKRLTALTWLTLLRRPAHLEAAEFTPRTPRERAAVARLRYESGDLMTPGEGVSLLLASSESQFTVFGQDTLHRIATDDPGALFETAAAQYQSWSEPLLVQVLVVCHHLGTSVTTEDLSWLTATLEHEKEAVREAATRALGNLGWRSDLRESDFLDRLLGDPSPRVRGAAYQTLAQWGDDAAVAALLRGLRDEPNARARLTGTNALVEHRDTLPGDAGPTLAAAWAWSHEQADFDRRAVNRGREVTE